MGVLGGVIPRLGAVGVWWSLGCGFFSSRHVTFQRHVTGLIMTYGSLTAFRVSVRNDAIEHVN